MANVAQPPWGDWGIWSKADKMRPKDLPTLLSSSMLPSMLASSCQELSTSSMAGPWASFFRISSGKRSKVSQSEMEFNLFYE